MGKQIIIPLFDLNIFILTINIYARLCAIPIVLQLIFEIKVDIVQLTG